MRKAVKPFSDSLTRAVMKQNDPETVRLGGPAYLLLADARVESSPEDPETLAQAAGLYSSYSSAFVMDSDKERARIISRKSKDYAFKAFSLENKDFALLHDKPFDQFATLLPKIRKDEIGYLFLVITTWASYIQTHSDNPDNIADVAKIRVLTEKLLEMDERYQYGSGHLFMGVLYSLLPPALGGKPEMAREHFEKAISISEGRFLQAYLLYAERYAKPLLDKELFDRLMKHVLDTPADIIPDLTLFNTIAKIRAHKLAEEAKDYF